MINNALPRVTTRYHTRYHELILFCGFATTKSTSYHALPRDTIGVLWYNCFYLVFLLIKQRVTTRYRVFLLKNNIYIYIF